MARGEVNAHLTTIPSQLHLRLPPRVLWQQCRGPCREGPWAARYLSALVPDLEEAIPGPRRHSHPVIGHPQAADAVVMPGQDTWEQMTAVTPGPRDVPPGRDMAQGGVPGTLAEANPEASWSIPATPRWLGKDSGRESLACVEVNLERLPSLVQAQGGSGRCPLRHGGARQPGGGSK